MQNKIGIGSKVRCIKNDKLDDFCHINEKLRWQIGDEMIVHDIEEHPWGTFLFDSEGHDINMRRVELIKPLATFNWFEEGEKVFDNGIGLLVKIEKISDDGYVVLDKTFGSNTSDKQRIAYLQQHGDDGRYSISFEEAKLRIKKCIIDVDKLNSRPI